MGLKTQTWLALIAAAGLAGTAWGQGAEGETAKAAEAAEAAKPADAADAEAATPAADGEGAGDATEATEEAPAKPQAPPPAFTTVEFERLTANLARAELPAGSPKDAEAPLVGDCAAAAPAASASLQARVAFAASVLKGCDTQVAQAQTNETLLAVAARVDTAHAATLGVWRSMAADLDALSQNLGSPEGLAAYAQARQARRDVEAALDGLRILNRFAFAAAQEGSYADPALLTRAFAPAPDAPQNPVAEVDGEAVPAATEEEGEAVETPEAMVARALATRLGCAGVKKDSAGGELAQWAFVSRDEDLEYGVIVPDLLAKTAGEFLEITLAKGAAPAFGFDELESYRLLRNCPAVKMRKFADETAADAAGAADAPDPSLPQAPGRGG